VRGINAAARSAVARTVAFVFAETIIRITDASDPRQPQSGIDAGALVDTHAARADGVRVRARRCASVCAAGIVVDEIGIRASAGPRQVDNAVVSARCCARFGEVSGVDEQWVVLIGATEPNRSAARGTHH
jgi:hypothetical protein